MKFRLHISMFFCFAQAYCQYGLEGAIYGGVIAAVKAPEVHELKQIRKHQEKIHLYTSVIAAETVAIAELENRFLESVTTASPLLDDLQMVVRTLRTLQEIYITQDDIIELLQQYPNLLTIATSVEAEIILEAVSIIEYGLTATAEGETNHMTQKQRIDILRNVEQDIFSIKVKGEELYLLMKIAAIAEDIDVNPELTIEIFEFDE